MIDDLKARVRELSDPDVEVLADPQRPCELRDHRVADDLITALALEVRLLRAAAGPRAVYAVDQAARTVRLFQPGGGGYGETVPFDDFTVAAAAALDATAKVMPSGFSAAWLRAYEELVRRGLIAGEVTGG